MTTELIVEDFDVIEDIGFHHIACLLDPSFDDGNYLLFHTECSVISNNFMLTQMDERKIEQIGTMMRLSPDALREDQPDVKYLLLRVQNFIVARDGKIEIDSSSPLGSALLSDSDPPEGFELIRTIWLEQNGQPVIYAKAFAVHWSKQPKGCFDPVGALRASKTLARFFERESSSSSRLGKNKKAPEGAVRTL